MFISKNSNSSTTWSITPGALRQLLQKKRRPKASAKTPGAAYRLPIELYLHIFSFLPPSTKLYPLLFIDPGFHAGAELRLYTNISLAGDTIRAGKHQKRDVRRRIKLFETLVTAPRFSHMVRSLTVPPFNCVDEERITFENQSRGLRPTYWHCLNLALRAVPNLKELTIGKFCTHQYQGKVLPFQRYSAVFEGCTFRLRKLAILSYACDDFQDLENCDALAELEELSIPHEPSAGFSSHDAFAGLTVLEVRNRTLPRLILPQIKALCSELLLSISDNDPINWDRHPNPELRSLRIHLLDLQNNWSTPIELLATSFPSLCFMHIHLSPWTMEIACIRDMATPLCSLVHLRKIVFRNDNIRWDHNVRLGRDTTSDSLQTREVAQLFFTAIPQLDIARVDVKEWRRDEIGIEKYTIRDDPEEWKDKAWWS